MPSALAHSPAETGGRIAPATALATALHLAEMNPEQLASASRSLLAAEERYDRMSGICATLNGLVLLEARRKVAHGNWKEWVQTVTGKSDRDARYRMRMAEECLASLSRRKSEPWFRFESAEQLLLEDFAAMLNTEAASPMDESNPVFAAVAQYVDGRSYRQLRDALPLGERGGNTYVRDGIKGRPVKVTLDELKALWRKQCAEASNSVALIANRNLYAVLNEADMLTLEDNALALAEKLAAWRKLTKGQREESLREAMQGKL